MFFPRKLLFSHDQFKDSFSSKEKFYFNFLFYQFKINFKKSKKKFDLVFYFKKNRNKGNVFLFNLIDAISRKYKIAVIGDKSKNYKNNPNIKFFGKVTRKKASKIIGHSKFALSSKENHFSFFVLDSLSKGLCIFYNKGLKLHRNLKTNMFLPIDFYDLNKSIKIIDKKLSKKNYNNFFNLKTKEFNEYLD